MELQTIAQPNETPEQHMLRLASMSQQVRKGRAKAYTAGLDAIHSALIELSDEITDEQKRVLARNPELLLLVMS